MASDIYRIASEAMIAPSGHGDGPPCRHEPAANAMLERLARVYTDGAIIKAEVQALHDFRHGRVDEGLRRLEDDVLRSRGRAFPWVTFMRAAQMLIAIQQPDAGRRVLEQTPAQPVEDSLAWLETRAGLWRRLGDTERADRDMAALRRLLRSGR